LSFFLSDFSGVVTLAHAFCGNLGSPKIELNSPALIIMMGGSFLGGNAFCYRKLPKQQLDGHFSV